MIDRSIAKARLTNHLLVQCAAQLNAKTREVEDLRFDNTLLQVRIRILELRLAKVRNGTHH